MAEMNEPRWPTDEETPTTCPVCGTNWESTDLRRHPSRPLPWWRCSDCGAEWHEIIRKHEHTRPFDALHRVYLVALEMTLHGKRPGNSAEERLGDLESAVLAALDELPYEL